MDILSLCRRMVMLFFCVACGFCAAKRGVMDAQSNRKPTMKKMAKTRPSEM